MQVCVMQTKTSIKEKYPGCLKGVGWLLGFFNRNIAFITVHCNRNTASVLAVVWCPDQWCISSLLQVYGLSIPVCPSCSVLPFKAKVGSSWWQWGQRPGDMAWKHFFLPVSDRSTFLSPWRFTVLNFLFCLKAPNKGRFVEDLYEERAHIWTIFQRGKIKCWTAVGVFLGTGGIFLPWSFRRWRVKLELYEEQFVCS